MAGAVAIGVELLALSENKASKDKTAEADTAPADQQQALRDSAKSHNDAAKSNQLIAGVTGAAGVVLIGVGVTLIVTSGGSSKTAKADRPLVFPLLGSGTAGLGLHTTF